MNAEAASLSINRRESERFTLRWPVRLAGGEGGWTRDISRSGVYIETDQPWQDQTRIDFVLMPPARARTNPLSCWGRVIRVERVGGVLGLAVALEGFSFGGGPGSPCLNP
jgi:hypothetical protein